MRLIDADAFSTEMTNYFKDKIEHLGDLDKTDDILEYNSDLHKMLREQTVTDYVTEEYVINVMVTFQNDLVLSAIENWTRTQVTMLKRLIHAVNTNTKYEEVKDGSSD